LAVAVACSGDRAAPSDSAWGPGFEAGPYAVGFRDEVVTRTTGDGVARPLTLSIWYPARAPGDRMRLGELLTLVLREGQLEEARGLAPEAALAAATTGDSTAIPRETARAALDAPTLAARNAEPAGGRFPLVLWGSRHATVLAQAPLAELLASHGMVVATAWSSEPPLAFIWEEKPESEKEATLAAQTDDLRFALATLRSDPTVDAGRTVLIAWSYGGQTAGRVQELEPGVRGVIGLDANIAPARSEESLRLRHPFLWLIGRDTTRRGLERLDSLDASVLLARLPELAHGDFNAMESHLPARLGADTLFPWSRGGEVGIRGFEALARMTLVATLAFQKDSAAELGTIVEQLRNAAGNTRVELRSSVP